MTDTVTDTPMKALAVVTRSRRRPLAARLRTVGIGLIVPVLMLVLWHVGVRFGWELPFGIRMRFLPYPGEVAISLWDFLFGGTRNDAFSVTFWGHLLTSVRRVLVGFALAVLVAVPLGVLMGRFSLVNSLFDVAINLVRPIPATAWVPLVALLIGYGDQATIFLIALSAFFPVVLGAISGARQVPDRMVEAGQMLGTSPSNILLKIVLPASAPAIVNGMRVGLGLAWVVLVLGETVGLGEGLGAMISLARDIVRTDMIVVGMLCIGLAGFLSDRLLVLAVRLVSHGRPLIK